MVEEIEQYQHALDFLYSFVDYSLTKQLRYSPEKFNLDRMFALMELMGNPHEKYPIIHVAGTKGKGSISAMTANILREAGYKVGLYTSPHLSDYCERIRIDNNPISHSELIQQVEKIRPLLERVKEITTFEITTAIAFQTFLEKHVDIAIFEVGLGGRLDATNIVNPMVSVISSLSYDHMNVLGNTIELIAAEKGGIIKKDRPVILAPQIYPAAEETILKISTEKNSPITNIRQEYVYSEINHTLEQQTFSVSHTNSDSRSDQYTLPLLGKHQIENAVTVLALIDQIRDQGFSISNKAKKDGLAKVKWEGRFERINENPLVFVDSAHNTHSAMRLSETIREYLPDQKIILIFGASEDKDISGMYEYLLPVADTVIFTKSVHPRAAEPQMLVELAEKYSNQIEITNSVEEAIKKSESISEVNSAIIVTGSIFVAAAAREEVQKMKVGLNK